MSVNRIPKKIRHVKFTVAIISLSPLYTSDMATFYTSSNLPLRENNLQKQVLGTTEAVLQAICTSISPG